MQSLGPRLFQTSFDQEWTLRQLKEKICDLDFNDTDCHLKINETVKELNLPDGNSLKLEAAHLQSKVLSSFFDFESAVREGTAAQGDWREVTGLQTLIRDCLDKCAVDTRVHLRKSILMAGGNLYAPKLFPKLLTKLASTDSHSTFKLANTCDKPMMLAAWKGA